MTVFGVCLGSGGVGAQRKGRLEGEMEGGTEGERDGRRESSRAAK